MTVWILETEGNTDEAFTFRLLPGHVRTVGRAPRADFIVDGDLVSRLHCRISAGAGEIEVADLDSTNGTYVNGKRVSRALLTDGDRLAVGGITFRVSRNESDGQPS
jgi:pSer/pThr/pTyr-binding forkhead associated (FHA) protein